MIDSQVTDEDEPRFRLPDDKVYMTPAGHAAIVAEVAARSTERHRVVDIVAWAAGNGDRSENADYKEGKRRLREIDRRLRYLVHRLAHAEVIDPAAQTRRDRVFFGATVTYASLAAAGSPEQTTTVTIVGADEADLAKGSISIASPVALALLRARVGDEVGVLTPRGPSSIEVVSIHYPDPRGRV